MSGRQRQTARQPATKFAHLRKKMRQNQTQAKIHARPGRGASKPQPPSGK
ncbi:MAG: hypothetical protein U0795_01705 [Pirellulales bacterium]